MGDSGKRVRWSGSMAVAVASLLIAFVTWSMNYGGQRQALADLQADVAQLTHQVESLQDKLDQYLLRHDGDPPLRHETR